MKHIFKIFTASALVIITLAGCNKKDDPGGTSTQNMSGEWWTEYYVSTAPTVALDHHYKTKTYNTAANDGKQIWVEDDWWSFKAKMDINYSSLSFKAMDSTNNTKNTAKPKMKVYEGKVIPGAGRSKSGVKVDSIFLKVEFLDEDPGTIYEVRGHARTGFFEDEY